MKNKLLLLGDSIMEKREKELRRKASILIDIGEYNEARSILLSLESVKDMSSIDFKSQKEKIAEGVAKRLNQLLKSNESTLKEISRKTGISANVLGTIKRGSNLNVSYAVVVALANYFGVSTDLFR